MFNFIRRIFSKPKAPYVLGAYYSPKDERNIPVSAIQSTISIPDSYIGVMPPVEDQAQDPKCVGECVHKIVELYFQKKGIIVDLSADDLYEQCKEVDGIPDLPGTYPSVAVHLAYSVGIATVEAYNTHDKAIIKASRAKHRIGGYAFLSNDYEEFCQTIYQKGAIVSSFVVDNNWFRGVITRVLRGLGRHCLALHGYDKTKVSGMGQNSWGVGWIGYIAGIINPAVKPGHFEFLWEDVKDSIADLIVLADIPQALIEQYTNARYVFNTNMKPGDTGYDVRKLQERLKSDGYYTYSITGTYGSITMQAVQKYQSAHGITPTGNCYPLTRASLNTEKKKI